MALTPCDFVPTWEHLYVYSSNDLNAATRDQIEFYKRFKISFQHGIYYDLRGNSNYCFILYFDLIDEYEAHKDIAITRSHMETLAKEYPVTAPYITQKIVEIYVNNKKYTEAWKILRQTKAYGVEEIAKYERRIKRSLLDSDTIKSIAGTKSLTEYGKKHESQIMLLAEKRVRDIERQEKCRLISKLIKNTKWEEYNLEDYQQYYVDLRQYEYYNSIDNSQIDFRWGTKDIPHTVIHALQSYLQSLIREAEDEHREQHGLPKIGEGWIGETELFHFVKKLLPTCKVTHHARPEWLSPQHLDVLIEDYNIAIEYQGEQHYRPVDFFGGEEAFEANKRRDAVKREKCIANDCCLIYIDKSHSQEYVHKIVTTEIRNKQ